MLNKRTPLNRQEGGGEGTKRILESPFAKKALRILEDMAGVGTMNELALTQELFVKAWPPLQFNTPSRWDLCGRTLERDFLHCLQDLQGQGLGQTTGFVRKRNQFMIAWHKLNPFNH